MIALAIAIRIMSKAVETLGSLSLKQIIKGLFAIGILLAEMTIAIRNFPDSGKLLSSAFAMVVMAIAIKSLTGSLERLAAIKSTSLIKSLGALAVILTAMTVSLNFMPDSGKLLSSSVAMLAMAIAISSITGSLERLAAIKASSLIKSLGAFAVVLGGITLALNFMPDSGKLLSSSVAMLAMAVAISSITGSLERLAAIKASSLIKSLGAFAVVLGGLVLALNFMPDSGKLIASSIAMLAMSASITIITGALERLSQIKATSLAKAIGGLGVSLLILSTAANSFNSAIFGAMAMVIVAGAVSLLAPALTMLSNINIGGLVIALGALAGTMIIFGIAASVLVPTIGVLLAFGAAVALAGIGLFALSSALGAIANIVASSGTQISEAFSIILQAIIDNLPLVGELIVTTFTTIFNAASEIIPQFVELVISTIYTIYSKVAEYVPMFAETGFQIILSFLAVIAEHIDDLVIAGASIVVSFLNGVASSLYMIIEAAFNLIISFINGLADAIREYHNDLWSAIMNLIGAICEALWDGVTQITTTGGDLIHSLLDEIGSFVGDMFSAGADLVWGFIDGLGSMAGHVWDAACSLATSAWNAITGTLDEHSPSRLAFGGGVNFIQGFINGMADREYATISEAGAVAYAALTAFQSGLDSGVDCNPTIVPVIDSHEIQNGISSINSMLYQLPETYGITADIANDNAMKKQLVEIMGSPNDYSDIVTSISALRNDLGVYNDQISKMQIVMDNGTLVGELTPGIDRSLGRSAQLVGRRV